MATPDYAYQPLTADQIRVLRIVENVSELKYDLFNVVLEEAPPFVALSYTWDDQPRQHNLLIGAANIKIIENVRLLLPYLYRNSGSQHFWIDGICINQDDAEERSIQVPRMTEIYSTTQKVVIWLGEGSQLLDQTIEYMPSVARRFKNFDGLASMGDAALTAAGLPIASSVFWNGIRQFYSHGWFLRLWTFQEAVLPKAVEFLCGNKVISFREASLFMDWMTARQAESLAHNNDRSQRKVFKLGVAKIMLIDRLVEMRNKGSEEGSSILTLLLMAEAWSVSDQRDNIYAIIGLSPPAVQASIVIDYKKPVPAIYVENARRWLLNNPTPWVLHMASCKAPMPDLPSWCPNFNSRPLVDAFGVYGDMSGYHSGFPDEKIGASLIMSSEDSNEIQAIGFQVDEVAEVIPPGWLGWDDSDGFEKSPASAAQSLDWEAECLALSQKVYRQPNGVPEAHWRTLVGNNNNDRTRYVGNGLLAYTIMKVMHATLSMRADHVEMLKKDNLGLAVVSLSDEQLKPATAYVSAMLSLCKGRTFFSTRAGRIGVGPPETRHGDRICVIYNAYTPFILRERREKAGRVELVGESYVHGLMYGEALAADGRKGDEIFVID